MKVNSKTFDATLERFTRSRLYWVIARVPFDVEKVWGTRGLLKVIVKVGGFEYPTSLFPTGSGEHFVLVNKKMQKAARITLGSNTSFTVTPDRAPREVKMPPELTRALNEERGLRKWFDSLKYSMRKWLADQVGDAKSPETRVRRAQRVAEMAMETMQAEEDLPPMIRQAFSRNPKVAKIFRQMNDHQKRGTLLAVFYYRTPQSRLRRLEKIVPDEFAND
jgi:uncharacterized protein YdeI (YjbR/CyaY-like superfamily)